MFLSREIKFRALLPNQENQSNNSFYKQQLDLQPNTIQLKLEYNNFIWTQSKILQFILLSTKKNIHLLLKYSLLIHHPQPNSQKVSKRDNSQLSFDIYKEILSHTYIIIRALQQLTNYMIKKTRNAPHSASEQIYPTCQSNSNKLINKLSMQAITTRTNQNKLIVHRLQTQPHKIQATVPFQDQWEQTFNRRENYLNSMFNRRKTVLQNISKKNRDIYLRITNQQSHYPITKILKQEHNNDSKSKNSIENLTANSRLMLTLSKHALKQQESRLSTISDKQNIARTNHLKADCKRLFSKNLAPILQNGQNSVIDLKAQQLRYMKDDINTKEKLQMNIKVRHKSVSRTRINDIYTNF